MISLEDQLGQEIILPKPAKRIISLVPSQTELLHYFGLDEETIGITKFCIHPDAWYRTKNRIGGTKNVDIEKIRSLSPELIIANKEENTKIDIEALQKICPVYVSDIISIEDALDMIKDVGILCGKEQKAVDLIDDIHEEFMQFPHFNKSVIYLIWREPYMAVGTDNFIDSVMSKVGLTNLIKEPRYVEISTEQIEKLNPETILLSTEPFPFEEKHQQELEKVLTSDIRIVDGEMFSWYGSRMLKMGNYFKGLKL